MLRPTISIITPTFNASATITHCLESVARQTYRPIEHWIIDGQSTDATLSIVKELSQKYDHIRYVSEPDRGIYDAMNKGIALAQGDWLYFLGGDDSFYKDHVLTEIFGQEFHSEQDVLYGDVYSTRFGGVYDGPFDEVKIFQQNICHQALFFRKTVFQITGLFDLRFKIYADWDHNIKWFLNGKLRSQYLAIIVANYADAGFSSTNTESNFIDERPVLFLSYDQGVLSKKWKARLGRAAAKLCFKKGDVVGFAKYLLLYARLTLTTSSERSLRPH
jgi:glycosyltransferase involved in cell wall biosynthesis